MQGRLLATLEFLARPAPAIGGAVVIALASVGVAWYVTSAAPSGAYAAVTEGPLTEEVDVSGTVEAAKSTDLSFTTSGRIAGIYATVGEHVAAGQVLLTLDHASDNAALAKAEASLAAEEAKLAALQAGTRPEQLSIDQSAVALDEDALRNALRSAYVSADDAIHVKADQLFANVRTAAPTLTITVADSVLANQVVNERAVLDPLLAKWNGTISEAGFASADPLPEEQSAAASLTQISAFLGDLSAALAATAPSSALTQATLDGYRAGVNTARSNVAAALASLTTNATTLIGAKGALTLALAGATPQDLAAEEAQVAAAEASVETIKVAIAQASIVAPISGTITAQNANPGETVSPGLPLVSLISDGAYEAQASVSEADITKVKVGDPVTATFAAYPGVSFNALMSEVAPAAPGGSTGGYPVKVTFSDKDSRLVAGLTANLAIVTSTLSDALSVPASAVITAGDQEFVYKKTSAKDIETPVTVGIRGTGGRIQITNGLSEGDEVLTFGNAQ